MHDDSARALITQELREDVEGSVLCWLATADADGRPNVSPKEIFATFGEDSIVIAHIVSPRSVANIRTNPQVCVSFVDVFRQRGFKVEGTARLVEKGEPEFEMVGADLLAMAGPDFPIRAVIVIAIGKVSRVWAPSYRLFPDRSLERFTVFLNRLGFPNQFCSDSLMPVGWRPASMTAPISNDLRERVVAAVSSGESVRAVAARFGVAASSVVKWAQRHRATGSVRPAKMGGYRKRILEPHRDFIAERLAQNPHLTLHGLKAELAARGITVSHNTIWEFLRSHGLRFKKNAVCP